MPAVSCPESLLLIAGAGRYPLLAARGARRCGVRNLSVIGFRGQTSRKLNCLADQARRLPLGNLQRLLDEARRTGITSVMLAGQITPACLFHARFDALARQELKRMRIKSAHTLFGRLAALLQAQSLTVLPATLFMAAHLTPAGQLGRHKPDETGRADLARGMQAALTLGQLDIGQTIVVKAGMVLAAEAFEGTDRAIRRGTRLGGKGAVVVKAARENHDMRFDVPVVGIRTLRLLSRCRVSALGLEAGRTLMLERERLVREADRRGIALIGLQTDAPPAPVLPA